MSLPRHPSLFAALSLGAAWLIMTLVGGLLQAGGTSSLDELTRSGVVVAIPLAAGFLLLAIGVGRYRAAACLVAPTAYRPLLLPALFVTALLSFAVVHGLPARDLLILLFINSFFVGLSEELMFRGVLLGALLHRFPLRRAVLIGAVTFGAVHSLNALITGEIGPAVAQSLIAVGMGLWTSMLRVRTGSLLFPIILHALWDFALFLILANGEPGAAALAASATALLGALILGSYGYRRLAA